MEENKKSNICIIVLVLILVIIILALLGYIVYDKELFNNKNNTIEIPAIQTTTTIEEEQTSGVSLANIEKIDYSSLDNIFSEIRKEDKIILNYPLEHLDNKNLLEDEKFKLSFAFIYGCFIDDNYDNLCMSAEEEFGTGAYYYTLDNYKKVYKSFFKEDFTENSIENTKYSINNNRIYGTIYSGPNLDYTIVFENLELNEINGTINETEDLNSTNKAVAKIKITYEKNSDNTVYLTGIYLSENN